METETLVAVKIPHAETARRIRNCTDSEMPCVVCSKPVKVENHPHWLWEHHGGGTAVTLAEGERLNAAGEHDGDLGVQPVGRDCLKKHPELKPFLIKVSK